MQIKFELESVFWKPSFFFPLVHGFPLPACCVNIRQLCVLATGQGRWGRVAWHHVPKVLRFPGWVGAMGFAHAVWGWVEESVVVAGHPCWACLYFHYAGSWVIDNLALIYVIKCSPYVTFRSLIHFEFIIVYSVRKCSNFILLHVAVQFSKHHLLKRLSLPHCIFLPALSKIRYP